MANICYYDIYVRGPKKAAQLFFDTMPKYDDACGITSEGGTDEDYKVRFYGTCKWRVDCYANKVWDGQEIVITDDTDGEKYWNYPLLEKSKMFHCEIEAFSTDETHEWQVHEHYKEGECIVKEIR